MGRDSNVVIGKIPRRPSSTKGQAMKKTQLIAGLARALIEMRAYPDRPEAQQDADVVLRQYRDWKARGDEA
jgi:hypothetical protein